MILQLFLEFLNIIFSYNQSTTQNTVTGTEVRRQPVITNTMGDTSETTFPASLLTGTKHSAFSTNHSTDIDKTKHDYGRRRKTQNL